MTNKAKTSAIARLLFLLALALGLGFVSDWYRNWNFKSWFNYWGKGPTAVNPADPDEPVEAEQIALFSVLDDDRFDEAPVYTITATVTPSNATNKSVDWAMSWANPDSDWATGKTVTDYIVLTPESDGALVATAECVQAFGEQIIVSIVCRENPELKANCTLDYKQKVTDVQLSLSGGKVDNTTLVGSWQLCDPTSYEFGYAASTLPVGTSSSGNTIYGGDSDYDNFLFTVSTIPGIEFKGLQCIWDSSGKLTGFWFFYLSSPNYSIRFADLDNYEDFTITILKHIPETVENTGKPSYSVELDNKNFDDLLSAFNLGLFKKLSSSVTLEETDSDTIIQSLEYGQGYSFKLDYSLTEGTIKRDISIMRSTLDIGFVSDIESLIYFEPSLRDLYNPSAYLPGMTYQLGDEFTIDLAFIARRMCMLDEYYVDKSDYVPTDEGVELTKKFIADIKTQNPTFNLMFVDLDLCGSDGSSIYHQRFYIGLDLSGYIIPVDDVTVGQGSFIF